jgi:hypothetical protein
MLCTLPLINVSQASHEKHKTAVGENNPTHLQHFTANKQHTVLHACFCLKCQVDCWKDELMKEWTDRLPELLRRLSTGFT